MPALSSYKMCATCGLEYSATLSHGMVDCVAELRRRINYLHRDLTEALSRASLAEETLAAVKDAMRDA